MHELSVARSLADFVCEQVAGTELVVDGHRVSRVFVRVGAMAAIVPQALKTAFREAVVGTPLQGSTLEIEAVDLIVWCPHCQQEQMLSGITRLRCPVCDTPTPRIVQGKELEIASIEVEEIAREPAAVPTATTTTATDAGASTPDPSGAAAHPQEE